MRLVKLPNTILGHLYLHSMPGRNEPIEEFFAELKAFIKRHWKIYETDPEQGFATFLEWCIDVVGGNERNARGHFRHAGLNIEELMPTSVSGTRRAGK